MAIVVTTGRVEYLKIGTDYGFVSVRIKAGPLAPPAPTTELLIIWLGNQSRASRAPFTTVLSTALARSLPVRLLHEEDSAYITEVILEAPLESMTSSTALPVIAFVFRPGGFADGNVFSSWPALVAAMSSVEGRKILEFDDSIMTPCQIPPGVWPMKDVVWAGFGPRQGAFRSMVVINEGAIFTDLRMIGGQITIVNRATDTSPVSDFSTNRDHVHIGLRDDCGNPQIVNHGNVAMFDLAGNSALFFVQNCLFGMPSPGDAEPIFPLIRHTGPSVLTINLLGQNQTGPNIVKSDGTGAVVLFSALTGAAQVAAEQQTYWDPDPNNTYKLRVGPVNRIQRQLLPLPPLPAARASQAMGLPTGAGLTLPNALIRCDGSGVGFTQELPLIVGGFTFGSSNTPLYSGGQELIVAEVAGGQRLQVAPTAGDTIDGSASSVSIPANGSRTFVSDGVSNWITTAVVT